MKNTQSPINSLLLTSLAQFIGFLLSYLTTNLNSIILIQLLTHGISAYILSCYFNISIPWRILNFCLPFAVYGTSITELPNWLPISLLLISVLIFLPTFWTRVPFYPTHLKNYETILNELPKEKNFVFIDLGSGFATLLFYLAKNRKNGKFHGLELSPLPYIFSKIKSLLYSNVQIQYKNFWKYDTKNADFVYAFLAPPPMAALWEKLKIELDNKSIIIINSFPLPVNPLRTYQAKKNTEHTIYIYKTS